jgi:hypothetical protein
MSAVGVGTYINTRAQTAVHLTDVVTGTLSSILAHMGLSSAYLDRHWDTIEQGLRYWIEEGSLLDVRLEIGDSSIPDAVFEMPIEYRLSGAGDVEFVTSQARQNRLLAKLSSVPAGSSYRVVVSHSTGFTPLSDWSNTSAADTSGLVSYSLGDLGSGPDARASLISHSRR